MRGVCIAVERVMRRRLVGVERIVRYSLDCSQVGDCRLLRGSERRQRRRLGRVEGVVGCIHIGVERVVRRRLGRG